MTKYKLADMTNTAFAKIASANPVILLPLGSHEDHGPFLPMGDYLLAETLALRIAGMAAANGTPCYVAPAMPFGVADYFGSSPGGMAVSAGTFRNLLDDLLTGLLRHGLTKIIILNGHGGNAPVIHDVTLKFRHENQVIIPSFYLWKIARQLMAARLGPAQEHRFGHGAEPLLSLTLAIRPYDVEATASIPNIDANLLNLPVTGFGTLNFEGIAIDVPIEFDQIPRDATQAAIKLASPELGAAVADDLVATAARFIAHFAA